MRYAKQLCIQAIQGASTGGHRHLGCLLWYCRALPIIVWSQAIFVKKKKNDIIIKHKNTQLQGYSTQIFKIVIYLPWCHPKLVCISFFWGTSKKIFCRTLGVKQCWSPLTFIVWTVKKKPQQNRDISQTIFFYVPQKIEKIYILIFG